MSLTITRMTSGAVTGNVGNAATRPLRVRNEDDVFAVFGTMQCDSSYVTGGYTMYPSAVGLKEIFFFLADGGATAANNSGSCAATAADALYIYSTNSVMIFGGAASTNASYTEFPMYTNLSWITMRFIAYGRR